MTVDLGAVAEFLTGRRIAVVGIGSAPGSFGRNVLREFMDHGYDVVPVSRTVDEVFDLRCIRSLADVEGVVDGAVVMVPGEGALDVIDDAAAVGIRRVWLFKGIGGPGAMSEEAVDRCRSYGMSVVAGACPFMFLEPVGGGHRFHRFVRRMRGALPKAA